MADQDIAHLSSITLLLPADRSTLTASASTGVDISAFEGDFFIAVNSAVGTGTSPTLDMKFQTSDAVGGTYADITGAAITQVADAAAGALNKQIVVIDKNKCKAFVRAVTDIAGTSPHFICAATIYGVAKYY